MTHTLIRSSRFETPVGPLLVTVFTVGATRLFLSESDLLFFSCNKSILEVILLCIAGYVLAIRGILDKKTQKVCLDVLSN